jgi:hypothetical protein
VKKLLSLSLLFLTAFSIFGQLGFREKLRSFDDLFPGLEPAIRSQAFSGGFIEVREKDTNPRFLPSDAIAGKIADLALMGMRPSCLVESLTVMPNRDKKVELLAIYNAMGKVGDLKGRLYHSFTRDEYVPLFEEATRIEGPRRTRAVPDPADSRILPQSDRIYVCLKDINFGNSYYQADIFTVPHGLLYGLSNFRNLSYGIIPVIKEKKFSAQFYVEPLDEGVLVYSIAAAEVSDFIAGKIDIPSAIRKRLEVILGWLVDNISEQ